VNFSLGRIAGCRSEANQGKSFSIIEEMRKLSTQNSEEIRTAVEDGKRRLEALVLEGKALGTNV
jgi:hypothetical protein